MTYTFVPKPTSSNYTNLNPGGKEQYDQASLTYDSATTYYDSINPAMWTDVAKPTFTKSTGGGMATGLLIPVTRPSGTVTTDPWQYVPKPS